MINFKFFFVIFFIGIIKIGVIILINIGVWIILFFNIFIFFEIFFRL